MDDELKIELPEIVVTTNQNQKQKGLLGDMDVNAKVDIDDKKVNNIITQIGITVVACAMVIFALVMLNNLLKKKI